MGDPKLQQNVIDYELNVVNSSPICDDGPTQNVCVATKALQVIFTLTESATLVASDKYYFQFLATLLCRLGTAICKKEKKTKATKKKKKKKEKKKITTPKKKKKKKKK